VSIDRRDTTVSVIVIEFITLDDGVILLGRATWQLFSRLWHSQVIDGDLIDTVKRERRDVIVTGSLSVVRELMAQDMIDEYRLLTFPTVLGTGERLFPAGGPPRYLDCLSAERSGATVLAHYGATR
jgi:dihydrofolate reductase